MKAASSCRFSRYVTQHLLAFPIIDFEKSCLGVIQAINKHGGQDKKKTSCNWHMNCSTPVYLILSWSLGDFKTLDLTQKSQNVLEYLEYEQSHCKPAIHALRSNGFSCTIVFFGFNRHMKYVSKTTQYRLPNLELSPSAVESLHRSGLRTCG